MKTRSVIHDFWLNFARNLNIDAENIDDVSEINRLVLVNVYESLIRDMNNHGETNPPFITRDDCDFIHVSRKMDVIITEDGRGARMTPKNGRFIARIPPDVSAHQRRDIIAHEIGHTYHHSIIGNYTVDLAPLKMYMRLKLLEDEIAREKFVSVIGRYLLAPESFLERHVSRAPSIDALISAANTFWMSPAYMAIRLVKDPTGIGSIDPWWNDTRLTITLNGKTTLYNDREDDIHDIDEKDNVFKSKDVSIYMKNDNIVLQLDRH